MLLLIEGMEAGDHLTPLSLCFGFQQVLRNITTKQKGTALKPITLFQNWRFWRAS